MKLKYEELNPKLHKVYCRTCGKAFWTTHWRKVTCSPHCSDVYQHERKRLRKGVK